jgi:hypothetical protein
MLDRPNGQIPDDAEIRALRRHSSQVRQQLEQGVDALKSQAHEAFDWKHHVRKHPLTAIAIAFAAGYLIVPKRQRSVAPAVKPGVVSAASEVIPMPESPLPSPPLQKSVMEKIGESLLQSALFYTSQRVLQEILDSSFGSSKARPPKGD